MADVKYEELPSGEGKKDSSTSGWGSFFDRSWLFRKPSQKTKLKEAPGLLPSLPMKIEPKTYFANERTFIRWATTGIHLLTIAVAVQVFTQYNPHNYPEQYNRGSAIALYILLIVPVLVVVYGLSQYMWRDRNLKTHKYSVTGDKWGPIVLSFFMLGAMGTLIYFILSRSPPPIVVPHGSNCTASLIGPASLYSAANMQLGDVRVAANQHVYVATQGYVLDFNPLTGVPSTPYDAYLVEPFSPTGASRPYRALEIDQFNSSSPYVFLGDSTAGARTIIVTSSSNKFWAFANISVESLFLEGDSGAFGGLAMMSSPSGGSGSYSFLMSGALNLVYQIEVNASLQSAWRLNVFPLRNVSSSLAQQLAAGNFNVSISAQMAAEMAPYSVSGLFYSSGTLYAPRDKANVLDMYTLTSTVAQGTVSQSMQWTATLGWPDGGLHSVQGVNVASNSLLVTTDNPAGIYQVWWRPNVLFGCYYGYNQTAP